MCGILVSVGDSLGDAPCERMLDALAHRGELTGRLRGRHVFAGTQRLPIVDRDRAVQPWSSPDGRWVLCFNGEIFNHGELRDELAGLGHPFRGGGDTEVLLAAFLAWGEGAVHRLRGEYAFAVVERATGRLYLARDPLGVKPLYWSRAGGCLHVASEVKALVPVGAPITELPPGHHGWADVYNDPSTRAHLELGRLGADRPQILDPDEAAAQVRAALVDSIRARVDTDLTVGVILSGGLDSSLTLMRVREHHPDCVAITIGTPSSPDLAYARRLTADLGVRHEVVRLRPRDIGRAEIREAIRISELTEYGDIINAVVSVPLFRRVRELGIRVVLTGDGSDELFGGYPMYFQGGPTSTQRLFLHKIENLCRTELQRVDRASMAHGVECRVPFLDPAVVEVALRLPLGFKQRDGIDKWIVRRAFAGDLPRYILDRPKNPMSYSSGLHERARLYKPLFARLHRSFGYDLLEPVRRDFDGVLMECDHDLDRAIAANADRQDYTLREHARDWAGALTWNAVPGLRRLIGQRPALPPVPAAPRSSSMRG